MDSILVHNARHAKEQSQVFLAHDCRLNLLKDLQHIQKYKLQIGFSALPALGGVAARQMR